MTTDDDRIRYLETGSVDDAGVDAIALGADEIADLDAVRDLLASPDLWSEPPAGLEDQVIAAITGEAGVTALSTPPVGGSDVVDLAEARRTRRWRPLLSAAAAAVLVAGAVAAFVVTRGDDVETFALPLESTELAPGLTGEAIFTRTESGWKIEFDVEGLERLDDGSFYEAWMSNGDVLVPVGTFNEGTDVVLWAGVSPMQFPILSVTQESADGDQSSSGRRVLAGEFDDTADMSGMDDG